jgi:HEAT repeat protein
MLLLDGLNEMGHSGPAKAALLHEWLTTLGPSAKVVVTCRIDDYRVPMSLGKMRQVIVHELDDTRIRQFATHYLQDMAEDLLVEIFPAVSNKQDHRQLSQLARNPYLLGALIYLFLNTTSERLPRNRGLLFQRLVQALWERERLRDTPAWVPFVDAAPAFAQLAFDMVEANMVIEIPVERALSYLKRDAWLNLGVSASLLSVRGEHVSFSHQLVQEYFAAVALEGKQLTAQLARPTFDERGRIAQKWDQVTIALSGIALDADTIVREVLRCDLYLAGMCIASGAPVSAMTRDAVISALIYALSGSANGDAGRTLAARLLGELHAEAAVPVLLDAMVEGIKFGAMGFPGSLASNLNTAAALALGSIGTPALPGLLGLLHSRPNNVVCWLVVSAMGAMRSSEAVPGLLKALDCPDDEVYQTAVSYLGKVADASVVPYLLTKCWCDDPYDYGWVNNVEATENALYAMGMVAVPQLLKAIRGQAGAVRDAAVKVLRGISDRRAIPDLVDALGDENDEIRRSAALALGWMGNVDAVPVLVEVFKSEDDETCRRGIIMAMGHIRDAVAVEGLELALRDQDHGVRTFAAKALASTEWEPRDIGTMVRYYVAMGDWKQCVNLGDDAVPWLIPFLHDIQHVYGEGLSRKRMCDWIADVLLDIGTAESIAAVEQWRREQSQQG